MQARACDTAWQRSAALQRVPEPEGDWAHVTTRKRKLEEESAKKGPEEKKARQLPEDYKPQPRKTLGVHRGASKHVDDFQGAVESAFSITGIRKTEDDDKAEDGGEQDE